MRLSHVYFTQAMNTRHMPRLHAKMASIVRKPFTSFAKIPTRDPETLPCYWRIAANSLTYTRTQKICNVHIRTNTDAHTRKNYPVSCTHTFQKLNLHLFFSSPNVLYQLGKEIESLLVLVPRLISFSVKIQV